MQDGTYSGEDIDGDAVSLTLRCEGDRWQGTLLIAGREIFVWLSRPSEEEALRGAALVPGEGTTWLISVSPFGEALHLDVAGSLYTLEREPDAF